MERRANAILNGRKRSTILSTSASAKPKSDESTSDVKKHRYAFTLLKKGNKQDSDSKLSLDATKSSTICSTLKQPIIPKDRIELNESSSFTSHEPLGSDLLVSSGTISHAGNSILKIS